MLQRVVDETKTSRFLLKGGTLLQHRLGGIARATKDVDGMVRGDMPDHLAGLAMSYQIAQKIHAATDPHEPPDFVNERARDAVDLLLLRRLAQETGEPTNLSIYSAIVDIFEARAVEARALGRTVRTWPASLCAYEHWTNDYETAAKSAGVNIGLEDAVVLLNEWLTGL
jgi:hypothetical protein